MYRMTEQSTAIHLILFSEYRHFPLFENLVSVGERVNIAHARVCLEACMTVCMKVCVWACMTVCTYSRMGVLDSQSWHYVWTCRTVNQSMLQMPQQELSARNKVRLFITTPRTMCTICLLVVVSFIMVSSLEDSQRAEMMDFETGADCNLPR